MDHINDNHKPYEECENFTRIWINLLKFELTRIWINLYWYRDGIKKSMQYRKESGKKGCQKQKRWKKNWKKINYTVGG